ncbi:hypothetical protein ABMB68_009052 [Bradyrhizobium sp. RT4a]
MKHSFLLAVQAKVKEVSSHLRKRRCFPLGQSCLDGVLRNRADHPITYARSSPDLLIYANTDYG